MAASMNDPHVQARFFTKQRQYAVPDNPFSVPITVGTDELNNLINGLLTKYDSSESKKENFDFLVAGELLRVTLEKHITEREISTETVVEIEYVVRLPAPKPEDSLLHDDWVSCVRAAGEYILSGVYDNTIRLWNLQGEPLLTIPGHSAPVKAVAWVNQDLGSPHQLFLSSSHDQTVLLWQWNTKTKSVDCLHVCRGHAGSVDCIAVDSTKTRFCTGSWDQMLKIWSAVPNPDEQADETGEKIPKKKKSESKIPTRVPLMTLSGHTEGITSTLWMDVNQICTSSFDHTIRVWDLEEAAQKSVLHGSKAVLDVSYCPLNKLLLSASSDRHVRLYDPRITDGAVVQSTFTSHTGWVSSVDWSPTNQHQFLSGSYDNMVKLWDTRSPKAPLYNLSGHDDKVMTVDWSLPEYLLSGGADNSVKIFKYTNVPERT